MACRGSIKKKHTYYRSNLVILTEEGYTHLPELYANHKVEIAASLPYYSEKDTDRQRGNGVFKTCQSLSEISIYSSDIFAFLGFDMFPAKSIALTS